MKPKIAITLMLCAIFTFNSRAQKEASVWSVGAGKQINFQDGAFEYSDFSDDNSIYSTICDTAGNLVLYTDGLTVWNSSKEILENGTGMYEDGRILVPGTRPFFIPLPDNPDRYILLYETIPIGGYSLSEKKMVYATIDISGNYSNGRILEKNVLFHDNYHYTPTICGYCDNSYYWILVDRNDNIEQNILRDRMYFYKIDKNGLNRTPVVIDKYDMGHSAMYRFSPNGDKFFFYYYENSSGNIYHYYIADFNFRSCEIYNIQSIPYEPYYIEYSSNSCFLYFFHENLLIQQQIGSVNGMNYSRKPDTLLVLPSSEDNNYPGTDLQLAPDGKIYFYYSDVIEKKHKLGRINSPNFKGIACNVEIGLLEMERNSYPYLPEYITSFFREKHPEMADRIFADAGKDRSLCANSSLTVGTPGSDNAFYQWFPESGLANPFSSETVYAPNLPLHQSPQTKPLTLRATDGNCWVNFDVAEITLLPYPRKLPLDGSWSVCPFVEGVDYETVDDHNTLQWLVDGGEIVTSPRNDSIKVNWFDTNPNASVSVFSTNSYDCISDTTVFPVRINVELLTETPKGPEKICYADATSVAYKIRNTNGSVYEWEATGGKIIHGQGTNRVVVYWKEDGLNELTVKETSVTIDTICFGESEPLVVNVFNDSLQINLLQMHYDQNNKLVFHYFSERLHPKFHTLFLVQEGESGTILDETEITGLLNGEYIHMPTAQELEPEIFSLKVVNSCNEIFKSSPQQTVVLRGYEIRPESKIRLFWNNNRFWENQQIENEIWHSADGKENWELVAKVGADTEFWWPVDGTSLLHYFRIRQINKDLNTESWSTTVKFELIDDLTIPDVFTPNGDGYNDEWQIGNIAFHQFKSLSIFDKHGVKVYECKNEFIPWDGRVRNEIFQGTYLYEIVFENEKTRYGQITVLQ